MFMNLKGVINCAILLNLMIFAALSSPAQPFQVGHTTITFTDPSRNNRSIATEIYYPSDVAGNNVPVTTAVPDKFPVLVFGHGFTMTWSAYENIWNALAPEGFILAFPKTEGSLLPSHNEFAKDLAFVIAQMQVIGQNTSSVFYNRVNGMNCVMGHSMGGGAAFLAAQMNPGIKSIVTLAAAETSPSAISAAASLTIPSLVIAGGNDCVAPPASHQLPLYNALPSSCKTYLKITGGSHCQMAESNFYCNFGEATCSPSPTISRSEQHAIINRYLVHWLNFELKEDCSSGAKFDSIILADQAITYLKNCILCNNAAEKVLSLSLLTEGLYTGNGILRKAQNATGDQFTGNIADQITVELHNSGNYNTIQYAATNITLSTSGQAAVNLPADINGSYYITIKHRNSIETTTSVPVSFSGNAINYSFNGPAKAWGGNLKLSPDNHWLIYGGDVNQDGLVNSDDMTTVDYDSKTYTSGYMATDINGDGIIDSADMTIPDNNGSAHVSSITP